MFKNRLAAERTDTFCKVQQIAMTKRRFSGLYSSQLSGKELRRKGQECAPQHVCRFYSLVGEELPVGGKNDEEYPGIALAQIWG